MSSTIINASNLNLNVRVTCLHCNKEFNVVVNKDDMANWFNNPTVKVQDAFPYLSADERELFVSRICKDCWDEIFKPNENE